MVKVVTAVQENRKGYLKAARTSGVHQSPKQLLLPCWDEKLFEEKK
jgi:hypothetical protein